MDHGHEHKYEYIMLEYEYKDEYWTSNCKYNYLSTLPSTVSLVLGASRRCAGSPDTCGQRQRTVTHAAESAHGSYMPRVTQLRRIIVMLMRSNQLREPASQGLSVSVHYPYAI